MDIGDRGLFFFFVLPRKRKRKEKKRVEAFDSVLFPVPPIVALRRLVEIVGKEIMEIDVPTCLSGRGQRAFWDGKSFDALVSPRTRKKIRCLGYFNNSSTMAGTIADFFLF